MRGECVATSSRRTPAEQDTGHQCDVESETVLPFISTWGHRIMTCARCFSLPAMAVDGDFVVVSGHFGGICTCFLTRPAVSTRHGRPLGSRERYSQRRPDVTVRNSQIALQGALQGANHLDSPWAQVHTLVLTGWSTRVLQYSPRPAIPLLRSQPDAIDHCIDL